MVVALIPCKAYITCRRTCAPVFDCVHERLRAFGPLEPLAPVDPDLSLECEPTWRHASARR